MNKIDRKHDKTRDYIPVDRKHNKVRDYVPVDRKHDKTSKKKNDTRQAFFVVGAESSGTRMLTEAFISAGCYGSTEHLQRLDYEPLEDAPDLIVFRRSIPHAGTWPNIGKLRHKLQKADYSVTLVYIYRDEVIVAQSQIRDMQHAETLVDAAMNISKADELMLKIDPDTRIDYEQFVTDEKTRKRIFEGFGLPVPDGYYYNANLKYNLA